MAFGPDDRLLGVLNRRDGDAGVVCLLTNVGVTHRVGPRRLNVKLARALAEASVSSFRFDLSGIGDSGAAEAGEDYRQRALADMVAAMDRLQQTLGVTRFVVVGICSGAVNGYRAAMADRRVVGLMMFDGYAHPSVATQFVHDWTRMRTLPLRAVWQKVAGRARRFVGQGRAGDSVSIFYAAVDRSAPDRTAYGDALDALAARGVSLLVAYSGSLLTQYNHESQFRRVFRGRAFLRRVEVRFLPHVDHIVTAQSAQAEFLALVVGWLRGAVLPALGPAASLVFDEPGRLALAP